MATQIKDLTVYFDIEIFEALKAKALESNSSLSNLVNEAVSLFLAEDEEDLAAFDEREQEAVISYEELLADLQKYGKI